QQVLSAAQGVLEGAVSIVEQRRVSQAPLLLVLLSARKTVRVQLAAEAVKLMLQSGQIEVEMRMQPKNRKIIPAGRGLNLAAMRTEKRRVVVADRAGPAGDGNR